MGQLVLLVVAAAWAAVLVPPLLRSRIENRPNSSVSDFRNQLSSLQRAMPSRGVAMRSMARPLAPSPLSRPAATGRPAMRSGRPHPRRQQPGSPAPSSRAVDRRRPRTTPRPGPAATATDAAHGVAARPGDQPSRRPQAAPGQRAVRARPRRRLLAVPRRHHQGRGDALRVRRRFVALCGYVCVLGQLRQREQQRCRPRPSRRPSGSTAAPPAAHRGPSSAAHRAPVRRHAGRPLVARRLTPPPAERRCRRRRPPVHSRRPRGCSSVGRAQQSHC